MGRDQHRLAALLGVLQSRSVDILGYCGTLALCWVHGLPWLWTGLLLLALLFVGFIYITIMGTMKKIKPYSQHINKIKKVTTVRSAEKL